MIAIKDENYAQRPPHELRYLIWQAKWKKTARAKQKPPEDVVWTELGVLAGRGFGKTLMGAQWLADRAYRDVNKLPHGVIAPTLKKVIGHAVAHEAAQEGIEQAGQHGQSEPDARAPRRARPGDHHCPWPVSSSS